MNKRKFCLAVIFVLSISLSGCAVDLATYPRPGYVAGVYPGEVIYPLDVYPYFWGGWYYYPDWNGSVWVYNRYPRPLAHWRGHALRHHGPPPRHWSHPGFHHRHHAAPHLHHRAVQPHGRTIHKPAPPAGKVYRGGGSGGGPKRHPK